MDVGVRAARDQMAMERILKSAGMLAGRFGLSFDTDAVSRRNRDPAVQALWQREGVADLLDAMVAATEPTVDIPDAASRLADMTVPEIRERIETADGAMLDRIEQMEEAGRGRSTVLAAIDRRRNELDREVMTTQPQPDLADGGQPEAEPVEDESASQPPMPAPSDGERLEGEPQL